MLKPDFEKMNIGQRLQWMLDEREMSQVYLAKQCGLTQAAISNLKTDTSRKPSAPTLLKLSGALQCSPEWLMTGKGSPDQSNTLGANAEQELIELFRQIPPNKQSSVIAMIRVMLSAY